MIDGTNPQGLNAAAATQNKSQRQKKRSHSHSTVQELQKITLKQLLEKLERLGAP